ncbi:uncharacterized protein [Haliotis cracherodii]|uniref:uncharacterized protein n=1 Tax=Haliotis cracherodii TaxID=6455 RepID=UPI0039ED3FA8
MIRLKLTGHPSNGRWCLYGSSMALHPLWIVLMSSLLSVAGSDFIGYKVTSSTPSDGGYSSIVLEGLPLAIDVVTGFYVTMSTANCPIKLQIWRRLSYLKYKLLFEKELTSSSVGPNYIPLEESEQFMIFNGDRLGFSSLSSAHSCVAYTFVTNPGDETPTLRYGYSDGIPPVQGNTYTFDMYKQTYRYGIGILVKYGNQHRKFFMAGTERVIGHHVNTDKLASAGKITIILEGVMLTEGMVSGYYVRLAKANCPIKLQIWRPTSGRSYDLLGETNFMSNTTGYFHVPSSNPIPVTSADKVGFSTLDDSSTCVPYMFVADERRSQTVFHDFFSSSPPAVNSSHIFSALQTTYLFAVEVAIVESFLLPPGPRGATGATGTRGIQGLPGPTGEGGDKGDQGRTGEQGPQGDRGSDGAVGPQGSVGSRGRLGPVGKIGPQGEAGVSGQVGTVGQPGEKGPIGETGSEGPLGEMGDKGSRGPQGEQGVTGDSPKGRDGDQGPRGPEGETGPQGKPGEIGLRGDGGPTGMTGADGARGARGHMWTPADLCKQMNVTCEQGCTSNGLAATCTCRPGYRLTDGYTCIDIDECFFRNGMCQHDCINTVGSFRCDCPLGLVLSKDLYRCNDVDECKQSGSRCGAGQTCINTWGDYYCAGPWEEGSIVARLMSSMSTVPLVTRHVMIGLILWLVLLTLLTIMAIILFVPELTGTSRKHPKEPVVPRGHRPEFYYPAFFPRISLDRRPSVDKVDVMDAATPRRMSVDEANAGQEEMYSHVQRGVATGGTERKRSNL